MKFFQLSFSVILLLMVSFILPSSVSAVAYDLIAPSGTLTRGQEVQFIIDIDAQGENITSKTIGMTYENQFIEFVSATPGDAMTSVTATETGNNTILISGTNTAGFKTTGVFAYVTFKIIAANPGTTELCALFEPQEEPTVAPTAAPIVPTRLPETGTVENMTNVFVVGLLLLVSSVISLSLLKQRGPISRYQNRK